MSLLFEVEVILCLQFSASFNAHSAFLISSTLLSPTGRKRKLKEVDLIIAQ